LFAATPPLEALKILLPLALTEGVGYVKGREEEGMKIEFIDIKRACLQADAKRDVYIELPQEDEQAGMCAKLKKAMHGTRDVAQSWEATYRKAHEEWDFGLGRLRLASCSTLRGTSDLWCMGMTSPQWAGKAS
jgi:hypothetical protein